MNNEKKYLDIQNSALLNKVELSKLEMEKEVLKEENAKILNKNKEQFDKIEELEKDLVTTKQKLGEVLNEISEIEQAQIMIDKKRIPKKK